MLVLAGGFSDVNGHYNKGDVLSATRETEHEPIADPGVGCINLTVTEGPLRFRKMLPRVMGLLFGF
jgi:putative transcriptional regulator